jgi:hypothetical protein
MTFWNFLDGVASQFAIDFGTTFRRTLVQKLMSALLFRDERVVWPWLHLGTFRTFRSGILRSQKVHCRGLEPSQTVWLHKTAMAENFLWFFRTFSRFRVPSECASRGAARGETAQAEVKGVPCVRARDWVYFEIYFPELSSFQEPCGVQLRHRAGCVGLTSRWCVAQHK